MLWEVIFTEIRMVLVKYHVLEGYISALVKKQQHNLFTVLFNIE